MKNTTEYLMKDAIGLYLKQRWQEAKIESYQRMFLKAGFERSDQIPQDMPEEVFDFFFGNYLGQKAVEQFYGSVEYTVGGDVFFRHDMVRYLEARVYDFIQENPITFNEVEYV